MFGFMKKTAFVSGVFSKDLDDNSKEKHYFVEYATIGLGGDYPTAKDFIQAVRELHRKSGYSTKFDIVKF